MSSNATTCPPCTPMPPPPNPSPTPVLPTIKKGFDGALAINLAKQASVLTIENVQGMEVRCTGQKRKRAMEVLAIASGGGRIDILNELLINWGLLKKFKPNDKSNNQNSSSLETKVTTESLILPSVASINPIELKWIGALIDESKAIWIACKAGRVKVIKTLIQCPGLNLDLPGNPNNPTSPLTIAKKGNHDDIVAVLLKHGATAVELKNANGINVNRTNPKNNIMIQSAVASMCLKGTDPFGASIRLRCAEMKTEKYVGREWLSQKVLDALNETKQNKKGKTLKSLVKNCVCLLLV